MNYSIIIFVIANGIVGIFRGKTVIFYCNHSCTHTSVLPTSTKKKKKEIFSEENKSGTARHHAGVGLKVFSDFHVSKMPKDPTTKIFL